MSKTVQERVSVQLGETRADYRRMVLVETSERKAQVTSLEQLTAQIEQNVAGVTALAQATATNVDAISQTMTLVEAQVGAVSAQGFFQVYTEAASSGALSRIALTASATAGGTPTTAAMWIETMSNGRSRIIFDANEMYWTNGTARDRPMAYINGELSLQNIRLKVLRFDQLLSNSGKLELNGINSFIRMIT